MAEMYFKWLSQLSYDIKFENLFKKDIREGEERLVLAVLENAVEHFQKYILTRSPQRRRLFQDAEKWFLERDSERPFSFENICETLQLHPDYVRQGLLRWKEEKLRTCSADRHPPPRPKLARSRVTHLSVEPPRTA